MSKISKISSKLILEGSVSFLNYDNSYNKKWERIGNIGIFENTKKTINSHPDFKGYLYIKNVGNFTISLWKVRNKLEIRGN